MVPGVNALTQEQVAKLSMDAAKARSTTIASDGSLYDKVELAGDKKRGDDPGGGTWVRVWYRFDWARAG
jgi:hypothetical protein